MKKICRSQLVCFVYLLLATVSQAASPGFMMNNIGTVNGQIFIDGRPAPYVLVSFFHKEKGLPPIEGGLRRVPEFLSRTDAEGKFMIELPAGDYYAGVLIRKPGEVPGPPREGEQYYFVRRSDGELGLLSSNKQEVNDLGRLNAQSYQYFKSPEDSFSVEGFVRNKNGNPVPGVVVLAKSQLNIPRPEFISERTDGNGFYKLRLPPHSAYYLVARETVAGSRPSPGSHIGTYGIESDTGLATPSIFGAGSPPPGVASDNNNSKALTVSGGAGEVLGNIDIYMYTVPDPEGIRASIQGTVNSPKYEKGIELENITFSNDSYKLEHGSFKELDEWASFLKTRADIKVLILGHTDNVGRAEYNRKLSQDRAQAVAHYLISKSIDPGRISVQGMGSEQPIADNSTDEGRKANRRVEIKFVN